MYRRSVASSLTSLSTSSSARRVRTIKCSGSSSFFIPKGS